MPAHKDPKYESNLCKNAVEFLSKLYHGPTVHMSVHGVTSDEIAIEVWPILVFSFRTGTKYRAIAVPNLGLIVEPLAIASICGSWFQQLDEEVIVSCDNLIKRTHSPIYNRDMLFSPTVTLYTNALIVSVDHVITAFSSKNYMVYVVNEADMYKTVFISYGGPDEQVASRINSALKDKGITTWFFPDDAVAGEKLHRVMYGGVNKNEKVLMLCSENSLTRPGVLNELERVLEREAREGGADILVPVALDDFVFTRWKPQRTDIAEQIRSRVVASVKVRGGKRFNEAIEKIVRSLRKSET